jgi:hypothetical protein
MTEFEELCREEALDDDHRAFIVIDRLTGQEVNVIGIVHSEAQAQRQVSQDMPGFALAQNGGLALLDGRGFYTYCQDGRFRVIVRGNV